MKKIIIAVAVAATTLVAAPAVAAPKCTYNHEVVVTQSRDITGQVVGVHWVNGKPVYEYGHGVQYRTVTTARKVCGKSKTTVTWSTPWHY